jgi:hypothetical protein
MTAAGELLNLPVAIPMRPVVSAYNLPQRRGAARYAHPRRVYGFAHRERPDTLRYRADGYTTTAPDKGNIIDLFA